MKAGLSLVITVFLLTGSMLPVAQAGELFLDFDTDPTALGIEFDGTSEWRDSGGVDGSGYLAVTDALNSQRGLILFPDLLNGEKLNDFEISADLRVGGGTDRPADGFSFNFVPPDDPILEDHTSFAGSPNGTEANLPEEGTQTGLAIGFDEWDSGAPDIVGMSIRIDGELVEQIPMPTLNGEVDDVTSLQTGPQLTDPEDLGWAPFEIKLSAPNKLLISYKNNVVFDDAIDYTPFAGQFVFAGRTGGANANHHIDNLRLVFNQGGGVTGDFNGNGSLDIGDIDDLTMQSAARTNVAAYDVTGDSKVDDADIKQWIRDLKKSWMGDANLDGEFNSGDLVVLFTAGTYENGSAAKWSTGDFDGDGLFTTSDLVVALTDGGYEQGVRAAVSAVPEPASVTLLLLGTLALRRRR